MVHVHAHVCALCCVSSLMCLQRLRYQWLAGKEAHIVVFCQKKKYNTTNLTSLPRLHGQRLVGARVLPQAARLHYHRAQYSE